MKKRIGAVLMGVLLGTSLIGTNVFATETEPPAESETVFEIVEGATGTYVKGSKKDHVIKVRMSTTAEKIHKVTVDNPENELDRDNWSDGFWTRNSRKDFILLTCFFYKPCIFYIALGWEVLIFSL